MTLNNRTIQESILEKTGKAKKNPLSETRELLRMLGDPQKELRIIHVAGTNGKGSCCAFLESILRESGLKTGLFTSPHLIRMNERIQVCGEQISDDELSALSGKIDEAVLKSGVSQPTFFEYMLLAAVLYFRDKAVDIAVIEAGMGGLNDATNILENKEAAVITSIGMDHMQYLGDTIEEIAEQKAGIMRAGVPCYYYAGGEAEEVIISNGRVGGALLRKLDNGMITDTARTPGQVDFFLSYGYHKLGISIKGDALYQRINASLAVMFAIDAGIDDDTIKRGIIRAERPARMEEVLPGIFLDGAHNVPAAAALRETLESSFRDREKLLVYGASR
ncbi:MAG: bifunctional folylpolyglutamate synthase/dihydrofolate synthase, partial [Lachnospiraceae bacterium]|nr:bifunctional folylpolyglutamate synthase/dihydrofolate synthase [Lachnospiraceae bacterium]